MILTCVNLLQYAQACYFYQYLFGSTQVPRGLVQTVGALVTGSALSWLYLVSSAVLAGADASVWPGRSCSLAAAWSRLQAF